jgi:hypothetical protein
LVSFGKDQKRDGGCFSESRAGRRPDVPVRGKRRKFLSGHQGLEHETPFFCPGIAPELPPDILKYRKPYVLFERQGFFLFQLCPLPDQNHAAFGVKYV